MSSCPRNASSRCPIFSTWSRIARRGRKRYLAGLRHAAPQHLPDEVFVLVQSGKPVGVFRTHARRAARAHRELEPRRHVGDLGALPRARGRGQIMFGQMTAGSWIYIGTQGILQGTYETFAASAREALRRHARRTASSSPAASAAWAARSRSPRR